MIVFRAVSSSFKKNAFIPVIGRIQVDLYTHHIEAIHLAEIHDVETSRAICPLPELSYISKATVSGDGIVMRNLDHRKTPTGRGLDLSYVFIESKTKVETRCGRHWIL